MWEGQDGRGILPSAAKRLPARLGSITEDLMQSRFVQLGTLLIVMTTGVACSRAPVEPACLSPAVASRTSFACLSDVALLDRIAEGGGTVTVGFKEAGATRGVDATGRNVTSEQTTTAMKQLLLARGITFTWQATMIPAVAGYFPLRLELVRELRQHPNVDYLEPAVTGTFTQ